MSVARRARLRALAKINLDLRVLGPRPDGYHELRTIFQTISLADSIEISFTPARATAIELADPLAIPDNLVARAARLVLDAARVTGRVEMRLAKRIPMGAGLGGGSSDAAAVLLALPVLAGRNLPLPTLLSIAAGLGSDVPFFLLGGAAVGIGRGTELFPLPDSLGRPGGLPHGIVIASDVHVSTADAYRRLSPRLTTSLQENKIFSFQTISWQMEGTPAANDFEEVVFEQHPSLSGLKRRLQRAGASPALMTGSGSAVFGLFRTSADAARALKSFKEEAAFRIQLISRARYRGIWQRALKDHAHGRLWPPQSRYAK